jgi:hypothetical protein
MIATTTERKSLIPEVRIVGKRFIIEEKVDAGSEGRSTPALFDGGAAHEIENPVVKTGLIPKHVWG